MARMLSTSNRQTNKSGFRHRSRKKNKTSVLQMVLTLHSGPKRYDYSEEKDDWIYSRDGKAMSGLLNGEISQIVGRQVELGVENISERVN
jgi:frataxin-like iron-binding protein CyaY